MPTAPNTVTASAVNVPTTTETPLVTTPVRAVNAPGAQGQSINGVVNITVGTAGTAVTLRVRAGNSITGALIGVAQTSNGLVAGNSYSLPYSAVDPTITGNVQYTVTAQQTAATGNGTANVVTLSEQTSNSAGS